MKNEASIETSRSQELRKLCGQLLKIPKTQHFNVNTFVDLYPKEIRYIRRKYPQLEADMFGKFLNFDLAFCLLYKTESNKDLNEFSRAQELRKLCDQLLEFPELQHLTVDTFVSLYPKEIRYIRLNYPELNIEELETNSELISCSISK